jgi:hypothetical protein
VPLKRTAGYQCRGDIVMYVQVIRIFGSSNSSRPFELAECGTERSFLPGGISGQDFLLVLRSSDAVFSSRSVDGTRFCLRGPIGSKRMPGKPAKPVVEINAADDHSADGEPRNTEENSGDR